MLRILLTTDSRNNKTLTWNQDLLFPGDQNISTNNVISNSDLTSTTFDPSFAGDGPAYAIYGIVPEPSTYALILGGTCLFIVAWQRKRRAVKSS